MRVSFSGGSLGEYFALQRGTTYKSRLLGKPGPVLLGLATIARNGGFRRDSLRTYGGESPEHLLVHPGDLYVSLKDVTQSADLLGAIARLPRDHQPGRLTQDTVKLVPRADNVPLAYVYWLLRTPHYREYCRAHATGTTNLGLAREDFLSFQVPELTPQRHRMVRLLDALDDKIDVNRQLNETLEQLARVLFKSWFVDFDPVHAKGKSRALPGVGAATEKLFPREFVESELGPIPKNWKRAPLGEWVTVLSGGTPSKGDPSLWNGDLPWISPKSMTSLHADEPDAYVAQHSVGNGTRLAPPGATLVMVRGMGLHYEVRVSQARTEVTFNQDVKALVPEAIEPSLLLFAMLHAQADLLGRVETSGHGTGKLPSEILLAHNIVMPPQPVQGLLARGFDLLNERFAVTRAETRTLVRTRDELIPRLLSGELSVASTERAAEATA